MRRFEFTAFLVVAAVSAAAGGASAECLIEGGGRQGVIQDNDLVNFGHPITGATGYKRTFTDAEWSGKKLTLEPKGKCIAVTFGPKGHTAVRERKELADDLLGVGCECK